MIFWRGSIKFKITPFYKASFFIHGTQTIAQVIWGQFHKLFCTPMPNFCTLCPTFENLFIGSNVQRKARKFDLGRKSVHEIGPWGYRPRLPAKYPGLSRNHVRIQILSNLIQLLNNQVTSNAKQFPSMLRAAIRSSLKACQYGVFKLQRLLDSKEGC